MFHVANRSLIGFIFFTTLFIQAQVFIPFGVWTEKDILISALIDMDGPQNVVVVQNLVLTNNSKNLTCDSSTLSTTSSNVTVVAVSNISFFGTYPNCKLSIYSTLNSGTSTITVTAINQFNIPKASSFVFTAIPKPVMAFSFRKILKNYLGSAVRVRRVSDNVESDIGFDSNGNFDLTAYNAFKGASSVRVKIWYDQSGSGYDATQTTNSLQPTITIAGFNGAPQMEFGSSSTAAAYWLETTQAQNVMSVNRDVTVFFAGKATKVNQNNYGSWNPSNSGDRVSIHLNWSDSTTYWDSAGTCCSSSRLSVGNSANEGVAKVYVFGRNDTIQYIKINGTTVANSTTASGTYGSPTTPWYLGSTGAYASGTAPLAEYMQYLAGLTDSQVNGITNEEKNYFGL